MKTPPLTAVRAFETVARHLSFTQAAQELSVTVTAVSQQVRQLEEVLGHQLFTRRGNRIELTTIGASIYPDVHAGLDMIARPFAALMAVPGGGSVRLTATRAFAERWLMPRLERFSHIYPEIVVHIEALEDGIDLSSSDVDLAIRYGPAPARGEEIHLACDRYIAVTRPSTEEGLVSKALGRRSLLAFKWKNTDLDAPSWSQWFKAAGMPAAAEARVAWYSEETLAFHAAERGLGVLLCSDLLAGGALEARRLQRLVGPALPGFNFRLVPPPVAKRTRATACFTRWLRDEFARPAQTL
ncbi:LysR substrate-binding domain-containing protein [Larsenimonas suaedae]|uniref:LysR substrate-binding domain-containing protein n=1 Tax=Larsenimonas suaedae TaxID=1851019 RepID=A0ABU1GSY3_9GAMM|nr:LysR substrate-binding domain-containing protein [Larsenimonas suaedae]MCM2972592.1 LysR substrate-binding domain-containing protein [Larsenimonas suaedae]MDR5894612.1 LysR substrate-binding domain-containing protein [Larsenimonas suaedae]